MMSTSVQEGSTQRRGGDSGSVIGLDFDARFEALTGHGLRHAAEERCSAELSYVSLAGRRSRRLVDPYLLWLDPTAAGLYVTGYDHDRREVRTFHMDRIRGSDWHTQELGRVYP
jgi:hypothetical protein